MIEEKLKKYMVFVKEKKISGVDYILVVREFYCDDCEVFHQISVGDIEFNQAMKDIFSGLGFIEKSESDFVIEYEACKGYKLFEKSLILDDEDYKGFIEKFRYDLYKI